MDYTISSEAYTNEDGSDFVDLAITWADGRIERHSFASFFDSPSEPAAWQAASFVAAFEETQLYTLEERLGPYGIEWEREQEERRGW